MDEDPVTAEGQATPPIMQLADDLVLGFLQNLEPDDVVRFSSTCRRFQAALQHDNLLWRSFCSSSLCGSSQPVMGLGEVPRDATWLATPEVSAA